MRPCSAAPPTSLQHGQAGQLMSHREAVTPTPVPELELLPLFMKTKLRKCNELLKVDKSLHPFLRNGTTPQALCAFS